MNKTEIVQWLVGHIFDSDLTPDFAVIDLWTIMSAMIEYLDKETSEQKRDRTMYEIRSILKGMLSLESP